MSNLKMTAQFARLTSTIGFLVLFGLLPSITPAAQTGTKVWLGVTCLDGGNARQLFVRYVGYGNIWLNDIPFDETGLRAKVAEIMANMQTKRLWIAADERMSYGEVVALIEKLQHDTPDLAIGLATRSQTGPVDPAQFAVWRDQKNRSHLLQPFPPCFPMPAKYPIENGQKRSMQMGSR